MKRYVFATTLLLILALPQALALNVYTPQRHLTTQDGLLTDTVIDVTQDQNGFLWITSVMGINKYDGTSMIPVYSKPLPFNNPGIHSMFAIKTGGFLVYHKKRGFFYFNPDKDTVVNLELLPSFRRHRNIQLTETEHDIWVITPNQLYAIDKSSLKMRWNKDFTPEHRIVDAAFNHDSIVTLSKAGIHFFDTNSEKWLDNSFPLKYESNSPPAKLIKGDLNQLYVISDTKIKQYNVDENYNFTLISNTPVLIRNILSTEAFGSHIFIGNERGIYRYNVNTHKVHFHFSFASLTPTSKPYVVGQFADRNGTLWFWGDNVGLFSIELFNPEFINYDYKHNERKSLSHPTVWGIHKQLRYPMRFWVTTGDGLSIVNTKARHPIKRQLKQKSENGDFIPVQKELISVVHESNSHLWIETYGELLYVRKSGFVIEPLPLGEKINQVFGKRQAIYRNDLKGRLWASNGTKLHYLNLNDLSYTDLTDKVSIPSGQKVYNILGFVFDNDELFLSTQQYLLSFNLTTAETRVIYSLGDTISKDDYSCFERVVFDRERNVLWLTHLTDGLHAIDASTFVANTRHYEVLREVGNAYSPMLDHSNLLWLSTHNGIIRYNPEIYHYTRFTKKDGVSSNEFNAWAANSIIADEQFFYYGGTTGITAFNPNSISRDMIDIENQVNISKIETNRGNELFTNNTKQLAIINLDYTENSLTVHFTNNLFHIGQEMFFEYTLEHNNVLSKKRTDNTFAELTQLPYGKSIFKVSAISPYTGEYSSAKTLVVNVQPPLWRSDLAYTLYIVLGIILAGAAWRVSSHSLIISHSKLSEKETRFRLALAGSNSEVWSWHRQTDRISGLRLKSMFLSTNKVPQRTVSHDNYMQQIHPEDRERYQSAWAELINSNDPEHVFSITYRLQHNDSEWVWYKDLGRFVNTDDGNTSTVSGTYSDVTEYHTNQDKLQIYGEVLQRSHDWVLLLNHDFTQVRGNPALLRAFNVPEDSSDIQLSTVFDTHSKRNMYRNIMLNMNNNGQWKGEEILHCANGQYYHLMVTISSTGIDSQRSYIMMMNDITELKRAEQELRTLALEDQLTGLQNRRAFNVSLQDALAFAKAHQQKLSICFIDLNGFKQINDTLGHRQGDTLLQTLGQRLLNSLPSHVIVSRVGGDEFTIIIPNAGTPQEIKHLIESVVDHITQPVTLGEREFIIDSSIGVAIYPEHGETSETLLQHADIAMYIAKKEHIQPFMLYHESMVSPTLHRQETEAKLRKALQNNTLIDFYQPIVDTQTKQIQGVELLMRWKPNNKIESIGPYISLAEELELLPEMTNQVFTKALANFKQWLTFNPKLFISVNLSTKHMKQANMAQELLDLLAKTDISPQHLCVEISEKAGNQDIKDAMDNLSLLQNSGVRLSLDDFGSHSASFNRFRQFQVAMIKIDMSFIQSIGEQVSDEVVITKLVELSVQLQTDCIAEGVETQTQWDFLATIGCKMIQGYLYSPPVSADAFNEMIKKNASTD